MIITLITICLVIGFVTLGINIYIISIGGRYFTTVNDIEGTYDCSIVPGARVWSGGVVSYMLRDRLDYSYKLYEKGAVKKILVSGDHGDKNYDEVNTMRQYLMDKGVPIEDIFMDHAGFDTYSTMTRAKKIFEVESAIVCTQKYHLYRSVYIAKKKGIDIKGISSDVYKSKKLPYYKLREAGARVKAFLQVEITKPDPILGESIPISGDGRITENGKT
jgi:vancomycin permeability regulator SanA